MGLLFSDSGAMSCSSLSLSVSLYDNIELTKLTGDSQSAATHKITCTTTGNFRRVRKGAKVHLGYDMPTSPLNINFDIVKLSDITFKRPVTSSTDNCVNCAL